MFERGWRFKTEVNINQVKLLGQHDNLMMRRRKKDEKV